MRCVVALGFASGCFSPGAGDALPARDANPNADATATPTPSHRYRLAGTFADEFGGPSLVPHGGSFGPDGYSFRANEGLSLTGAIPASVYTIDVAVALDQVSAWRKLVDFKGLTREPGVYVNDGMFSFVARADSEGVPIIAQSSGVLAASIFARLTLVRDADMTIRGYINRALAFTFIDSIGAGTVAAPANQVNFVIDDFATNQVEASGGKIRDIWIWDVALTGAQIADLPQS